MYLNKAIAIATDGRNATLQDIHLAWDTLNEERANLDCADMRLTLELEALEAEIMRRPPISYERPLMNLLEAIAI